MTNDPAARVAGRVRESVEHSAADLTRHVSAQPCGTMVTALARLTAL